MTSERPVGTGIAAAMVFAFGGEPACSVSWVVASAHSSESARVSRFIPPGSCTTTVVPESSGTRNSSRMRCSTLKTWLSAGSRSPKLLPVVSGRYGTSTVSAMDPRHPTENHHPAKGGETVKR